MLEITRVMDGFTAHVATFITVSESYCNYVFQSRKWSDNKIKADLLVITQDRDRHFNDLQEKFTFSAAGKGKHTWQVSQNAKKINKMQKR